MPETEFTAARLRERIVQENPREHETVLEIINTWLGRGDGIAVYVHGRPDGTLYGESMYVSYGSSAATLTAGQPPDPLVPDSGYRLAGTYRGEPLKDES